MAGYTNILTVFGFLFLSAMLIMLFIENKNQKRLEILSIKKALGENVEVEQPKESAKIDKKLKENHGFSKKFDKLFNIDDYEKIYYPTKPIVFVLIACLLSLTIEFFIKMIIRKSGYIYEISYPFLTLYIARNLFDRLNNRRRQKLFYQMPDALDSVTRSIRIGISLPNALLNVSKEASEPTRTEFMRLASNLIIGVPLSDAIKILAKDNKIAEYKFLAIAIVLQSTAGGSIGSTLENVANVVRSRVAIKLRGKALTGEARASAAILTSLPVLLVGVLAIIQPTYIDPLFLTQAGRHYLSISIAMLFVGQYIMRNMVRKTLDLAR